MENTQKRITGRAPSTYTWEDRGVRQTKRRVQPHQPHGKTNKPKYNTFAAKLLPWITLCVVVLMIGMIIGKWSAITSYKKMEASLLADANELSGRISNLISEYNLEIRADIIKQEAVTRLGMVSPEPESIYFFENVKSNTSDVTLAAEGNRYSR